MKLKRCSLKALSMLACFGAASALLACQPEDGDDAPKTANLEQKMLNGSQEEGFDAVCALVRERNNNLELLASGVLIDKDWVLSAISSTALDSFDLDAHLDQVSFAFGDSIKDNPRLVGVDRVERYPYFISTYVGYLPFQNVALYHLKSSVTDITPARIAEGAVENWLEEDLKFVGFGASKARFVTHSGGISWNGDDPASIGARNVIPLKVMDARWFVGSHVSQPDPMNGVYPTILWLNDERFVDGSAAVTELYGPSAGDEGAPGFIEEDGELRMVATIDYANYMGGNLANRLQSYKPWIDAVIAGEDPNCNDDKSVCSCEAACMPDGVCNNWVCGENSAFDCYHVDYYIGELWNNNDYPITAAYYFIDATYAGLSLYNEKFACTQAHRNDYTPCVELLAACMADGPRSGEVDCYDTAACELNCLSSGCDCLNTDKASYEGILHYMEVYYCLYTHGCEADDAECAHEHCAEYLDACYEKASCDVISNGCPDGQACAISSYRDPVCRPAGDKQLGDECRMGASDCAAGLVCSPVEDLKEATCVVPCKGEDDCVDGHCVINSLTSAWLGEGVGYCKEGSICIDSDNDGYCAENDCNDGDPSIHPDNKEICGDSIDQNCNGQTDEGCEEDPPADASVDGDVDASDADVNADAESDASDAETSDADAESDASDAETSDAEVDIDASDASDAATEADAASNDATKEDADVSTKNDASSDAIDDDDGGDDGCSAIPGSHSGSFLALLSLPLMMIRRRKRA